MIECDQHDPSQLSGANVLLVNPLLPEVVGRGDRRDGERGKWGNGESIRRGS